jgi:Lanthionine synthetase C-like protein
VTATEEAILLDPDAHEPLADEPWTEGWARDAVAAIVRTAEEAFDGANWPVDPRDDLAAPVESVYFGAAGIAWALHRLGSSLDAGAVVAGALERYRARPDLADEDLAHPPSLLMGETGILLAAEAVGSPAADRSRLAELVAANRDSEVRELMWGSPGTIVAARRAGLDELADESAAVLQAAWPQDGLWVQELYGTTSRYVGPGHGFAGCVHALRGFLPAAELRERALPVLEGYARHDGELVNWLPIEGWTPGRPLRVQWCHGAPGMVITLADLMPYELALGGGELTWQAGPLAKGPGLCHGTAGNGYAFLRLHALTGDELWLERARSFAMHAVAQLEAAEAPRHGLFTGDIGVALFVQACLDLDPRFPGIDLW